MIQRMLKRKIWLGGGVQICEGGSISASGFGITQGNARERLGLLDNYYLVFSITTCGFIGEGKTIGFVMPPSR